MTAEEGEDIYDDNIIDKKFWEELIAYFGFMQHGPHRKQKIKVRHIDSKVYS
jgi:hypothetical protein